MNSLDVRQVNQTQFWGRVLGLAANTIRGGRMVGVCHAFEAEF